MTQGLAGMIGTLLAVGWTALLALAEGALNAEPRLATHALPPSYAEQPERLRRGLALGRIVLLALAALAFSGAVRWWARPPLAAAVWFAGLVAGLALVSDLLPRVIGLWRSATVGPWAVKAAAATLAVGAPVFAIAGVLDEAFGRMFGSAAPRASGGETAQREMLLGVFALADTMVSEVMTPRVDVVALDVTASFADAVARVATAEYARLPVFDGDIDNIVGVLHAKDLLPARFGAPGGGEWRTLVRPVAVVPEVKTLDRQLRDFQRGTGHLAVVVDEFGGTAGIVTLEDVLEEIVGEIRDEYDVKEGEPIQQTAPGVYVVDGRAPLADLATALGIRLEDDEVNTVGGYVVAVLGRVPVTGEQLALPGWQLTVERLDKRSVDRVRLERRPEPETPA